VTTYFYTASAVTGDVATYRLDHDAERLTPVATVHAGGGLSAMAVDVPGRRLYVADRGMPGILAFAIDPADGSLSKLAATPTAGRFVYLLLADGWIYGASYHEGIVCGYPLAADGIVGEAPLPPLALGADARCHAIAAGDDGDLWVSALGHDLLYRVARDETGAVTGPVSSLRAAAGSGPRHITPYPERSLLYVIGERSARIAEYRLAGDSAEDVLVRDWDTLPDEIRLAPGIVRVPGEEPPPRDPATGLPFTWAADLVLSPDGELLFSSERSSSTVSVTSTATGELLSWTRTEQQPRGIAVDPGGQFLLVTGELSETVSLYRVEDGGRRLRFADRVASPPGLLWAESAIFLPDSGQ
jgi:6-phosphogluconolactonase